MRKYLIGVLLAGAASLIVTGPALAKEGPKPGVSFFAANGATAGWAANKSAIVLSEPAFNLSTGPTAYAGATLKGIGTTAPLATDPPSFAVSSDTSLPSGGSPRLVIEFSDGGNIDGYYRSMNDSNPADMLWDSQGGSSGYIYGKDYATALAAHTGQEVTSAFIVTDSGWEGAYTNTITSVHYGTLSVA